MSPTENIFAPGRREPSEKGFRTARVVGRRALESIKECTQPSRLLVDDSKLLQNEDIKIVVLEKNLFGIGFS